MEILIHPRPCKTYFAVRYLHNAVTYRGFVLYVPGFQTSACILRVICARGENRATLEHVSDTSFFFFSFVLYTQMNIATRGDLIETFPRHFRPTSRLNASPPNTYINTSHVLLEEDLRQIRE